MAPSLGAVTGGSAADEQQGSALGFQKGGGRELGEGAYTAEEEQVWAHLIQTCKLVAQL